MSVYNDNVIIKPTPLKVGKWLRCGCCGQDFQVWEEYEDQDQDNGYGICKSCQADDVERNEAEYDKAIKVMSDGLNPANRDIFDAMERDLQIALVNKMMADGLLTWEITRSEPVSILDMIKQKANERWER